MSATIHQLLDSALTLSIHDRVELAEAILTSIQPTDRPPFSEVSRTEMQRRSNELQGDPSISITREELWKRVNETHV